jgi:ADP-ribosylglycohydrolase
MCLHKKACFFILSFVIFASAAGADIAGDLGELQGQLAQLSDKIVIPWPEGYQKELNDRELRYAFAPILCAAVGDALGRVTEKIDSLEGLREHFGTKEKLSIARLVGDGVMHAGKVRYSDDTLMALIVLEAALEGRDEKWSLEKMVEVMATAFIPYVMRPSEAKELGIVPAENKTLYMIRYHGGMNQAQMKRTSNTWATRILNKESTEGWWGTLELSLNSENQRVPIGNEAGCGSVMRAWPLALVFRDELIPTKGHNKAERLAAAQSFITHRHPMAQAACVALVRAMRLILNRKISVKDIVESTIKAAGEWRVIAKDILKKKGLTDKAVLSEHEEKFAGDLLKTSGGRDAARKALSADKLSLEDMLSYAAEAAYGGDRPTMVLGEVNDKGEAATAYRSQSGYLLGWAADEALAAALYVFIRWAGKDQLQKRKAEFTELGLSWDKDSVIWYALQEAAWTPGDSDSIATLAGALLGAYHSLKVPGSEKLPLVKYFESFDRLLNDARRILGKGTKPGKLPQNPGQLKKTTPIKKDESPLIRDPKWSDAEWSFYQRMHSSNLELM